MGRSLRSRLQALDSDAGSMLPLAIGFALLSLTLCLSILSAGALFLTDRRLTSVAEFTALNVLTKSESDPETSLTKHAQQFLLRHPLAGLTAVRLESVDRSDGASVRVRLCSNVQPVFPYIFSEVGIVCSEGLARFGR